MSMTFATKVIEQKGESKFVTGSGTAGQEGSSTVAYIPSLWTFNMGITPVAGDMITIKIPVAGNSSGVWMSVDNGTTYYPIATSGDARLTTQYPKDYVITVVFETGFSTKLYGNTKTGGAAGASLTSYTLDRWRIHNYYDSGNTDNKVTQTATTTNAAYEVLFSATADNTTRTEGARKTNTLTYNPNTKVLNISGNVTATDIKTGKVLAPTTSGGSTYGAGGSGHTLISSGSSVYWGQATRAEGTQEVVNFTSDNFYYFTVPDVEGYNYVLLNAMPSFSSVQVIGVDGLNHRAYITGSASTSVTMYCTWIGFRT